MIVVYMLVVGKLEYAIIVSMVVSMAVLLLIDRFKDKSFQSLIIHVLGWL